ncbi:hypothetical protein [Arenibacter troitsensis]|uniref:Uncharacterized protein n=1 Tax=Arenibacter troitsensis TaxID=188872 RepID=A0A1X7LGZ6_9FLAO|nr:hypothetical protein [Arenibacter troitsensis]SMG53055.1 hypothetical protein SAMN03080602_04323 [Arenibacter troitsensis]
MRTLSTEEKSFVKELVKISGISHNVFLANVVDRELNNTDVYLDYFNKQVEYRFDQNLYNQNQNLFTDFAREFSWRMMLYINLLRDLEKEGMLFMFQESPNVNNSRFGRLINGNRYISSRINDQEAISSLLKYSKKTILINQSLIDFEKNDFKTEVDLKHIESIEYSKKNLKLADESLKSSLTSLDLASKSLESGNKSLRYSRYTLIATILIFVIGTAINIFISSKKQEPFTLNEKQFNLFNNSLLKSGEELNSTKRNLQSVQSQTDSIIRYTRAETENIENQIENFVASSSSDIRSIKIEIRKIQESLGKLSDKIE